MRRLPARLSFDIGGRQLILLLEALDARGGDDTQRELRVRGFVNRGLEKTYVSGRGRLDRDWRLVAETGTPESRREAYPVLPGGE